MAVTEKRTADIRSVKGIFVGVNGVAGNKLHLLYLPVDAISIVIAVPCRVSRATGIATLRAPPSARVSHTESQRQDAAGVLRPDDAVIPKTRTGVFGQRLLLDPVS